MKYPFAEVKNRIRNKTLLVKTCTEPNFGKANRKREKFFFWKSKVLTKRINECQSVMSSSLIIS